MRARRRTRPVATLSDVARRAGVSTTTASYILNGRSTQMRISVRTQRRVREAAEALSYRPNRSARSLRTATTRTLGVVSDLGAGGGPAGLMLAGATAAARAFGHLVLVGETERDPAVERLLIEEMLSHRVDGVVYLRQDTGEVSVPSLLDDAEVVLLNCVDPAADVPAVLPDEYAAGRTAAEALTAAGVAGEVQLVGDAQCGGTSARLRADGVRDGLADGGHGLAGTIPCALTVTAAREAVHRWLMGGLRPTAMVCLNDTVAMGVYQALAAHALDVPRDTSVVSFGGSELAHWLTPTLTSVAVPYARMGELAVERLLRHEDEPGRPSTIRVPMPLVPGESVRSAATDRFVEPGTG